MATGKERTLARLEAGWRAFRESYAGLSDDDLLSPGVVDDWCVKDVIAHVTTWENEALKYLPVVLRGERPKTYKAQYGGIDAFNAQMLAEKRDLSLAEVRRQADETHRRLVEMVEAMPDEHFVTETRFRRRLRLDSYAHYPEHVEMIQAWRERQSP